MEIENQMVAVNSRIYTVTDEEILRQIKQGGWKPDLPQKFDISPKHKFVDEGSYNNYRATFCGACLDVLVRTYDPKTHHPAVIAARRSPESTFPNLLWPFAGGAMKTFMDPVDFARKAVESEFGLPQVELQAFAGIYHTGCPISMVDSVQPCIFAYASPNFLDRMKYDKDHTEIGLYTAEDLHHFDHPVAITAIEQALRTMA